MSVDKFWSNDFTILFDKNKLSHFYPTNNMSLSEILNSLGRHPFRPAHIHFMVKSEGFVDLTTHAFIDGDPYLETDTVFKLF